MVPPMRKTISSPLALVFTLAACGGGSGESAEASSAERGDESATETTLSNPESGDQDGDGDGDPTSGDGDPTSGDGDPTTGDGDPTSGDGDGDPGDGDGDPTTCGNGVVEGSEECDDGNAVDDDDCTNACVFPPSPCGTQSYQATLDVSPVDIIISIDNSGSMGQEIVGVQDNINVNFAQIIEDAGLDYRVIMVTQHGRANPDENVCIEAPLSGIPMGGCANPPQAPVHNPPIFFHYSTNIGSHNVWCELLDEFPNTATDQFGETGWGQWLRPNAVKTFIVISDDGIDCGPYDDNDNANDGMATAADFNDDLLALDPQFGQANDLNYSYFSIVGMDFNNPATEPYTPADPIVNGRCPSAAANGTGHQALSILTDGLRFPLCDTSSYDSVFEGIAQSVISGSPVSCELPLPDPPNMQPINTASIVIEYVPGGMGNPIDFQQVMDAQSCAPNSFYIENDTIYLCPDTCDLVQGDVDAELNIEYLCVNPN